MERWHDFFALLGTAAASLVGLIFVAISITAGFATAEESDGRQIYAMPTIVHLAVVLVAALAILAPLSPPKVAAAQMLFEGCGLGYAVVIAYRCFRLPNADLEDKTLYGFAPVAGYIAMLAGSSGVYRHAGGGLAVLAAASVYLLLVSIRNAWDLTVWIAIRLENRK